MKMAAILMLCSVIMATGCSLGPAPEAAKDQTQSAQQTEDWSEHYDRVIAMVYGDDFHMAYSMDEIVGSTDDEAQIAFV